MEELIKLPIVQADLLNSLICCSQITKAGFFMSVCQYIEDICFFEVNTKYISSSELKTSEFSRARVKFFMFSTQEMKYMWYSPKKSKFSFYFIQYMYTIHKAGGENAKTKNF